MKRPGLVVLLCLLGLASLAKFAGMIEVTPKVQPAEFRSACAGKGGVALIHNANRADWICIKKESVIP